MKYCVPFLACLSFFPLFIIADDQVTRSNDPFYSEGCQGCSSSVFIPRPQGLNSAAICDPFYYPCCNASIDKGLTVSLGYRYLQTWNGEYLAECLFGSPILNFAGSNATMEPSTYYLLAENFGLSPDFIGAIAFDPIIKNNCIDFFARYEFGSWNPCLEKLYASVAASLVNSSWDLRGCEENFNTVEPDTLQLPQCLMGTSVEPALGDIKTALSGNYTFGQLPKGKGMKYGKFIFDRSQSKTALANIDVILGYDVLRCDGYHLGLFVKTVAPTGNRPNPETVFSPIVGNAHHWELGGGLDGHWDMWSCDDQCVTAYLTGSITHLFDDTQLRTFDLKNCCMSRYQLLKRFAPTGNHVPYQNELMFGTDFTTRHIKSSFDMMGDATLKFVYRTCGFAFGVGYNVYGRSRETISLIPGNDSQAVLAVGNKGSAGVCAINNNDSTSTIPLNATQSTSCIEASDVTTPAPVDNEVDRTGYTTWNGTTPAPDSSKPVLVRTDDLDVDGVPRQLSQKLFGFVGYHWNDCPNEPYVTCGGECEFAQNGQCHVCTANQWSMWLQGGLSF